MVTISQAIRQALCTMSDPEHAERNLVAEAGQRIATESGLDRKIDGELVS